MQVTTEVNVVTTKTHKAVFSADEIKAVALSVATKNIGDAKITSSAVVLGGDGAITVEIVEVINESSEQQADTATQAPAPAAAAPAAPQAPTIMPIAPAAPAVANGG